METTRRYYYWLSSNRDGTTKILSKTFGRKLRDNLIEHDQFTMLRSWSVSGRGKLARHFRHSQWITNGQYPRWNINLTEADRTD